MAIDDGGPAFPVPIAYDPSREQMADAVSWCGEGGMSLRDWFAGQALCGILANAECIRAAPPLTHAERAGAAYKAADAMLNAREFDHRKEQ